MSSSDAPLADVTTPAAPAFFAGRYRWVICLLLFFATTINYFDRQILSLLKPILDDQLHWSNAQFGYINSAFQAAYAISLFSFGWFVDRFGTKIGYAISITAWSIAAAGHALVSSVSGFFVARVALGLGEGGNFPSSIKAVALWFPQRERAFATSLFNSGANVGALAGPAIVPFIAAKYGWHATFLFAAGAGLIWLIFWLLFYEIPDRCGRLHPTELALIRDGQIVADDHSPHVPLGKLLAYPQAWSFVIGKSLTDPVWWFFLIWLPDYFNTTRHLDIKHSWPLLVTIYGIVTVLSIIGGWAPGVLVRRGWTPNAARKTVMLFAAFCVVPILMATHVGNWTAVILIGLAGAAHQAWSANLYSTVSDMFPKRVVASVTGFGSMFGAAVSMLPPVLTGILLDHFKARGNITAGYAILFACCSFAYVIAFAVQHVLAPRFEPVELPILA